MSAHRALSEVLTGAGVALLVSVSSARNAHAQAPPSTPGTIELSWNAPAGCPSRDAILADIGRLLLGPGRLSADVRADVTNDGHDHWSVRVSVGIGGVHGVRVVQAESCAALASATALTVAWTLDPLTPAPEAPRWPKPPEPPPAQAADPKRVPTKVEADEPIEHSTSFAGVAALGVEGGLGVLPRASVAAEATVGVTSERLRLELLGAAWGAQQATSVSGEGARLALLDGSLRGCWRYFLGTTVELDPCVGATVEHASVTGERESVTFRPSAWTWLPRAELLSRWPLFGPVALRVTASAAAPLNRPPVVSVNAQGADIALFRTSAVVGRAGVGVDVHFP